MFKNLLFAAAVVMASSPAFVSAQDIFFSFCENSRVAEQTAFIGGANNGTAYIFADENLEFNSLDLDFTVSGGASITGVTTFNAGNKFTEFNALNPNDPDAGPTATDGRLFAVAFNIPPFVMDPGQIPGSNDADFRPGANGFLLAQVDFDLDNSFGTSNFDFVLGDLGIVNDGVELVPVTFGSGILNRDAVAIGSEDYPSHSPLCIPGATVPEPSSAVLLILGAAGIVARRRRS